MTLTAETVGLYAETLVRQVHAGGHPLDYTAATLPLLDVLFEDVEEGFAALPEAQQSLVVFYNGCYLGEVFVRSLGAQWQCVSPWFESTLIVANAQGGVQIRPFEKVLRRLTEGAEGNGLAAYFQGLTECLP